MKEVDYDSPSGYLEPICKDCDCVIILVYSRYDLVSWWQCPSCDRLHEDICVVDELGKKELYGLRNPEGGFIDVPRFSCLHFVKPGTKPNFDPDRVMRVGVRYVSASDS